MLLDTDTAVCVFFLLISVCTGDDGYTVDGRSVSIEIYLLRMVRLRPGPVLRREMRHVTNLIGAALEDRCAFCRKVTNKRASVACKACEKNDVWQVLEDSAWSVYVALATRWRTIRRDMNDVLVGRRDGRRLYLEADIHALCGSSAYDTSYVEMAAAYAKQHPTDVQCGVDETFEPDVTVRGLDDINWDVLLGRYNLRISIASKVDLLALVAVIVASAKRHHCARIVGTTCSVYTEFISCVQRNPLKRS
jgi:ribosomal protein L37AE/L43A